MPELRHMPGRHARLQRSAIFQLFAAYWGCLIPRWRCLVLQPVFLPAGRFYAVDFARRARLAKSE